MRQMVVMKWRLGAMQGPSRCKPKMPLACAAIRLNQLQPCQLLNESLVLEAESDISALKRLFHLCCFILK